MVSTTVRGSQESRVKREEFVVVVCKFLPFARHEVFLNFLKVKPFIQFFDANYRISINWIKRLITTFRM